MTTNESVSQELLERITQQAGDYEGLSWQEDDWLADYLLGVHPDRASDGLLDQIMHSEGLFAWAPSVEDDALSTLLETGEASVDPLLARGESDARALLQWQAACEQLLEMVKHGSPDVKMSALRTLGRDFNSLEAVVARAERLQELLNALAMDDSLSPSSESQVDWRGAVWKLLLVILADMDALTMSIGQAEVESVLTLVQTETGTRYRRMALRFLLARPTQRRSSVCQEAIAQSGGVSLLVNVLSTERDQKNLAVTAEAAWSSGSGELERQTGNRLHCSGDRRPHGCRRSRVLQPLAAHPPSTSANVCALSDWDRSQGTAWPVGSASIQEYTVSGQLQRAAQVHRSQLRAQGAA